MNQLGSLKIRQHLYQRPNLKRMKRRIIICGYPKSGNTWLTRLTAEIVGCPVAGFWCQPFNKETSIEGLDRKSEFQCFKSHHSLDQLEHTLDLYGNGTEKILYIYRDPRSVVVSGSHFFRFPPKHQRLRRLLKCIPKGLKIYGQFLHSQSHDLDRMTQSLVEGTTDGAWLRTPWEKHVSGFQQTDKILMLSYEDLRMNPLLVAGKISRFLSISRREEELESAIYAQSFSKKKESLQTSGERKRANFLRRGDIDSWKEELPTENLIYLERKIGNFMQELGYELTFNPNNEPTPNTR